MNEFCGIGKGWKSTSCQCLLVFILWWGSMCFATCHHHIKFHFMTGHCGNTSLSSMPIGSSIGWFSFIVPLLLSDRRVRHVAGGGRHVPVPATCLVTISSGEECFSKPASAIRFKKRFAKFGYPTIVEASFYFKNVAFPRVYWCHRENDSKMTFGQITISH